MGARTSCPIILSNSQHVTGDITEKTPEREWLTLFGELPDTTLESIYMFNCTDHMLEGMMSLPSLKNVQNLALYGSSVTDEGLRHLRGRKFQWVVLLQSNITGDGLKFLRDNTTITKLDIIDPGLKFREDDLKYLDPRMDRFILSGHQFADPGMAHVAKLTNLDELYLEDCGITDEGLTRLYGLGKLKTLHIRNVPKVSIRAVKGLKDALPGCQVLWNETEIKPWLLRPSPLDCLEANQIRKEEHFSWQPKELVAVIGEHRQRHWLACDSLAMSPDGRLLASVGHDDRKLRLWDPATMQSLGELEVANETLITSVAFSSDGRLLASQSSNSHIQIWDCSQKPPRLTDSVGIESGYTQIGFARGSDRLVAGNSWSGKLWLWDPGFSPPRHLATVDAHKGGIARLAVAPGGKLLVTSGLSDGLAKLWDVSGPAPREIVVLKGHKGKVGALAFSPDAKLLFTGDDTTVRVWALDGANTREKSNITQPEWTLGINAIACDRSGKWLAVAGVQNGVNGFHICTLEDDTVKPVYHTGGQTITALTFGPAEQDLYLGDVLGMVQHLKVGAKKATPANEPPSDALIEIPAVLATSGQGRVAIGHYASTAIWDLKTQAPQLRGKIPNSGRQGQVALSADGAFLASMVMYEHKIELWDLRNADLPRLADTYHLPGQDLQECLWVVDGKTLAVRISDKGFILLLTWDGDKLKEQARVNVSEGGFGMTISRDRKVMATWGDKFVRVWKLESSGLQEKTRVDVGGGPFHGGPRGFALSPDGQILAVGGPEPRLFDLRGPEPKETVVLKKALVHSMTFSPDGRILAGCGLLGEIVFWDPATGKQTRTWQFPGLIHRLAFSDDGPYLLTFNGNGTVYVLRCSLSSSAGKD